MRSQIQIDPNIRLLQPAHCVVTLVSGGETIWNILIMDGSGKILHILCFYVAIILHMRTDSLQHPER